MGGVDWDDVLERYLPLVDEIATRDDLSEVLWEMIGELGSSHAYERHRVPAAAERSRRRVPRRRPRARRRRALGDRARAAQRIVGARRALAAARRRRERAGRRRAARGQRPRGRRCRARAAARRTGRQAGRADDRARRHAAHGGRDPDRGRDADPLPGLGVRPSRGRARGQRGTDRLRARAGHDVDRLGRVQPRPAPRDRPRRAASSTPATTAAGTSPNWSSSGWPAVRSAATCRGTPPRRPTRAAHRAGRWCRWPTSTRARTATSSTRRSTNSGSGRSSACAPGAA